MINLTTNSQLTKTTNPSTEPKPVLAITLSDNGKSAPMYTSVVGDSEASSANSLNAIALAVLAALADTHTIEYVELNGVQVKLIDLVDRGVDRVLGKSAKSGTNHSDNFVTAMAYLDSEMVKSLGVAQSKMIKHV